MKLHGVLQDDQRTCTQVELQPYSNKLDTPPEVDQAQTLYNRGQSTSTGVRYEFQPYSNKLDPPPEVNQEQTLYNLFGITPSEGHMAGNILQRIGQALLNGTPEPMPYQPSIQQYFPVANLESTYYNSTEKIAETSQSNEAETSQSNECCWMYVRSKG
ncbi:uncharacterized protein LOC134232330 isoform X2 [Saccostrea cucullata]|uniref:uncharacterized protein LOC134232330 isoform X2 n=1 Tax=Saccostrea cuccullata TaxID=36930 RepID=UPI002ED3B397